MPLSQWRCRYAITRPEIITAVAPASTLVSSARAVTATPSLRIEATSGTAVVAGTFIADTLPPTTLNVSTHRTIVLRLPFGLAWLPRLAELDGPATLALLRRIEAGHVTRTHASVSQRRLTRV